MAELKVVKKDMDRASEVLTPVVDLYLKLGQLSLILKSFPGFNSSFIVVKSRTAVPKPRTNRGSNFVRDLNAEITAIYGLRPSLESLKRQFKPLPARCAF